MKQVFSFYRYAQDCRVMASRTTDPKLKSMMLTLALEWESLGQAREVYLAQVEQMQKQKPPSA